MSKFDLWVFCIFFFLGGFIFCLALFDDAIYKYYKDKGKL